MVKLPFAAEASPHLKNETTKENEMIEDYRMLACRARPFAAPVSKEKREAINTEIYSTKTG